ncbi:hypothetical protein [Aliivibrio fischeri]|uniref:hypothetical protein n=1 Tax=Aliivibrio fischeri TaxID=668 RepID=UPI003736A758
MQALCAFEEKMNHKNTKEFQEQIESVMKEPLAIQPSDYEEKIRRNLIIVSSVTLVVIKLGLMPTNDSRFLGGMQFDNLTPETIYIILLCIVAYEFTHYSWLLVNKFTYWRIRLTGIKHSEFRGNRGSMGSTYEQLDFTGNADNSNLYIWMIENKDATLSLTERIDNNWLEVENLCQELKSESVNSSKIAEILRKLNDIENTSNALKQHLENIRISASLHRFDNWFHFLVRSQGARWLLLDVFFPIIMGSASLYFLVSKLF